MVVDEGSEPSLPGGGTYFLGRYRIVDEIGVGGMASVHLARADGPGGFQKWVAIKRIHRHLAEDDQFTQMFLDEARIAARISHPNVAQVFDLGKHRDTYWIAMEYLHGEPLREVMRAVEDQAAPPMGPALAARMIADSAEGLHAAHELRDKDGNLLNLVHRDVTPHNLFLTYDGAVKVVDFGIAKVTGRLASTRAGTLKGKLAYMSPEQVRGASIDRRTDIFALGVVLWEVTVGRRLFRTDSDLETLERVQSCRVPPPSTVAPGYPLDLETVVMRALAKDPNQRYATARELSRALQHYLMRGGAFVGPDELGAYVKQTLADRFQKREEHLQWASEVTQTIVLDDLQGATKELEEVSVLTYSSDVLEVAERSESRPALSPHTPPDKPVPRLPELPMTPPSPPRPPQRNTPLPVFDANESRAPSPPQEVVHPSPTSAMPTPSSQETATPQSSSDVGPEMFTEEDDDAVTRIMMTPDEGEPQHTGSISTVHAPPKGYEPAPQPIAPVVVQGAASYEPASCGAHGYYDHSSQAYGTPGSQYAQPAASVPPYSMPSYQQPGPMGVPPSGQPGMVPGQPPYMQSMPPQGGDNRTVIVALIAAITTLIALGLVAFVVLRLTSQEPPAPRPVATPLPALPPTLTAAVVPPVAPTQPTVSAQASATPPADDAQAKKEEDASNKENSSVTPTVTRRSTVRSVAPKPKAEPGFLTVVCNPACDSVVAGGKNLGPSPVVRASLPPGTHSVRLKKAGAASKSINVKIVSGQTTARRVAMGS